MKKYFLTILICILSTLAYSQSSAPWFQRLTYNDGLSDNRVNWLRKSHDGYLWIGTQLGLNRYDGFRVQSYYKRNGDKKTLPDNCINSIYEDGDGMLWLNTGAGFCIFNPTNDIVNQNVEGWMKRHNMAGKPLMVVSDDDKNLWIVSSLGRLYYYDFKKKRATNMSLGSGFNLSKLSWLNVGGDNAYLIFNDGTIAIAQKGKSNGVSVDKSIAMQTGFQQATYRLTVDSRGGLWAWSTLGAFHYSPYTKNWKRLQGLMVKDVTEDNEHRIYIATDHNGLIVADINGNIIQNIVNNPADNRSLPDNTLQCVYVDDIGVLWVGLYRMGLAHFYRGQNQFNLLPWGDICTMSQSIDGSLWIGTNDSGIRHYNFYTKRLDVIGMQVSKLRSQIVVSSLATKDGSVWFGTFQGGMSRIKGGVATHYQQQKGGLANDNVWTLAELPDGHIIIGTLGGGVQFLNPKTGKFTTFNTHNSKLPSDYIASIAVMKDNMIAIGHSQGVALMNLLTGKIDTIDLTSNGDETLTTSVNQLCYDSRGLLWIATGSGLNVYDVGTKNLFRVNLSGTRQHSDVSSVTEDKNGTMWLAVGNEIKSINAKQTEDGWSFFSNSYGWMDGVQTRLFNQRSIVCLRNGNILVGGIDGINVVNTKSVHRQLIDSKVVFSGLSLFDRPVNVGDSVNGHVILDKELNSSRKLTLGHDENTFSILLASSAVGIPESPRFLYRLRGESDKWQMTTSADPMVQFSNLSPGSYTLEVRPVDSDGNPLSDIASMKIAIRPTFYLSVWALMIYAVLLVAIVWYFIWRVRRNRKEEVEKIEFKKKEEVDEAKMNFFTNIGHEFRSPLSLILGPLESMIRHEKNPVQVERMKLIQRNAFQLQTLTNQLLDLRRFMGNKEVLHLTQNDIVAVVKAVCNQFAGLSNKGITLTFHTVKETIYLSFDSDKTSKIVTNLLSNAYKFTPKNGHIDVSLSLREGKWVDIIVADDGPGISDEDKKHVFERFFQSKANKQGGGSGIGLSLVMDYAKMQGGTATVSDNPNGGAMFTVTLPFNRGHVSGQGYAEIQTGEMQNVTDDTGAVVTPKIYAYDKRPEEMEKTQETTEKPIVVESPVKPVDEVEVKNTPVTEPEEELDSSKATVLLVDDSEDFLRFLSSELSTLYNIRTAPDGQKALDIIHKSPIDLVITDITMPVMDGNQLCKLIKQDKDTANIPVIILTARLTDENELESLEYGADDYMKKPFNMQVLLKSIRLLISRSRRMKKKS